MSFAEQLKQLREKAGLTQVQLAEQAQISLATLREYEQGKRRHDPSLSVAARLAAVLGVSVDTFALSVLDQDTPGAGPDLPRGKAGDRAAAGYASPAALQAVGKLMKGLPAILEELKQWGRAHEFAMSPVAIRRLAAQLEKLFVAVQATGGEGKPASKKGRKKA